MNDHTYGAEYTAYQNDRSAVRRFVRHFYLKNALRQLNGPTLDLGCGVGELLAMLPKGSRGLEYNEATVEHCRMAGLSVDFYDGVKDGWTLSCVDRNEGLESLVISHVLEHLDEPMRVLHELLRASERLGIGTVLVIVPGRAGYLSDPTHRTFVDAGMLTMSAVTASTGFQPCAVRYFPGNFWRLGEYLVHHELQVRYSRICA